jgi:hypothetical protein
MSTKPEHFIVDGITYYTYPLRKPSWRDAAFLRGKNRDTKNSTGRYIVYWCDKLEDWSEIARFDTHAEANTYVATFRPGHTYWDIVDVGLPKDLKEFLLTSSPAGILWAWRSLIARNKWWQWHTREDIVRFRVLAETLTYALKLSDRAKIVEAVENEEKNDAIELSKQPKVIYVRSRSQIIFWCVLTMVVTLIAVAVYRHLLDGPR